MSAHRKKLFLSAVTREFADYRVLLAQDLKRPTLDVATQEDFGVADGTTLGKIDAYIRHCDGVIHLVGKATGASPPEPAISMLRATYPDFADKLSQLAPSLRLAQPGFSYTQWEAYLAMYHRRPLFVYCSVDLGRDEPTLPRPKDFDVTLDEVKTQQEHYHRISGLGWDRGRFLNPERLSSAVLRDLVEILPRLEPVLDVTPTRLPHNAERLIGRDADLGRLDAAWNDPLKNVVVVRAFGGMGKTSLVATWMAELARKNWRGAEQVFDWSFYSQGTRDQTAASGDTFIAAALRAFGDADPTAGSPWDRGARLAHLVGKKRCLLVLDGLEPLQHPPGPMEGRLKDEGIAALLKGLAAKNAGLCVVTTREKVDDIKQHYGLAADDFELVQLSDLAGAALLHFSGATRAGAREISPSDAELQHASREVRGHGLTLQLLGQYLRLAEGGDIMKRDTVRLADADREYQNDATRPYGHAFKAMEAYEKWFAGEGLAGHRQLAILRMLGLFDRPAPENCLQALREQPVVEGLTEPLVELSTKDWRLALGRLREINLVLVQADGSVDCHPLLREYFGRQIRSDQLPAWRTAHRRLYEYLRASNEGDRPTLEDLQPLFQAVTHGCHAELHNGAMDIYYDRIQQRNKYYATNKLGLFGSDISALACFFDGAWDKPHSLLDNRNKVKALRQAAFSLRAVGRLTEAEAAAKRALALALQTTDPHGGDTIAAGLVSDLELALGKTTAAVRSGQLAVRRSHNNQKYERKVASRCTLANALYQIGNFPAALHVFEEAERIESKALPKYPLLRSVQGFPYHELLLSKVERAAWRSFLAGASNPRSIPSLDPLLATCDAVGVRAVRTLSFAEVRDVSILSVEINKLTLARLTLYNFLLGGRDERLRSSESGKRADYLNRVLNGLRTAGQQQFILDALLTRAWHGIVERENVGAHSDLNEAWEIAERGPMRLYLADIHLYRARLFFRERDYPWISPRHDLAEARRLIEQCVYWRRGKELEDADNAIDAA